MSRFNDLAGKKYGTLTVLKLSDRTDKYKSKYWECRCECGNVITVHQGNLKSGHTKSCGCVRNKNLTGMRFGKWAVIRKSKRTDSINSTYWTCKCDCGTIKELRGSMLISGRSLSCGCTRRTGDSDLTGKKFGKLTVIGKSDRTDSNHRTFWRCRCECGNYTNVARSHLVRGSVVSCGCANIHNRVDLTGKKYGKLTVIEGTAKRTTHGLVVWRCRCDCGKEIYVGTSSLTSGLVQSCGCIRSNGERVIRDIFDKNKVLYETEKTFDSCRFPDTNAKAKFDFYIPNSHLIEFDGEQHFNDRENSSWKPLSYTKKHDSYKNQWCKDNNIPLIRIPYTHMKDICLEDLLINSEYRIV